MKVSLGTFEPSRTEDLTTIFERHVTGKTFLDLGSGIGHVVKFAMAYANAATGVEYERNLVYCTYVPEKILHEDFLEHDFSQYNVLYYYIYGTNDEKALVEKIKKEFTGIFIVYHGVLTENDPLDEKGNPIPKPGGSFTPNEREFYDLLDFELVEEWDQGKVYNVGGNV